MTRPTAITLLIILCTTLIISIPKTARAEQDPLSPVAIVSSPDAKQLYIACASASKIVLLDIATSKLTASIDLPAEPTGLALSPDGKQLFVTCAEPAGSICIIDTAKKQLAATLPAGWGACSPVLSPKGDLLFVCNRFNNEIAAFNLSSQKQIAQIPVQREPIAAAITPDGKFLFVANHLPSMAATSETVAASVSIIDTAANTVAASILLTSGSASLKGVAISPDGKYACVTHILGRFTLPTTQIERGWINTNAMSIIDIGKKQLLNTILLDDVDSGAANPWAVQWSADNQTLCVTHAGTHELSIINAPAMFAKLAKAKSENVYNDLAFLVDIRNRIRLKGNGPRSLALVGTKAYAAEYFTDSISIVDLPTASLTGSIPLGPAPVLTTQRKGEMFFHDAALCFQGWQSCSSCHPDARVDALNWDLLNDGMGNPKNTKSMLLAHQTPPAMSLGIRENAEYAVRSGIRYILFATRPEQDAVAIDEYLKSLKPLPSPWLVNGQLSSSAQRGRQIFMDPAVGCASCHTPGLFTSKQSYDVGTSGKCDRPGEKFDTPTLVEIWRTAPYLHDGSAATLRDVLTTHNKTDQHGKTSHLSKSQLDDLIQYLRSL